MSATRLTLLAAAAILVAEAASAGAIRPGDLLVTDTDAKALIHVDPVTGDRTILSSPTVGGGAAIESMARLAVESTGQVVVTSTLDDAVFRIDPDPGDRAVVSSEAMGTGPGFESPLSVAITVSGILLVSDVLNTVSAIYRVDPVTGDRTVLSDANHGQGPVPTPWDISLEASGDVVVATLFNGVFRVDATTGDRSVVSNDSVGNGPPFSRITGIAVESEGTDPSRRSIRQGRR